MSNVGLDAGFKKQLGLFDCAMLVAGAMIGSGIFLVSPDITRTVGSTGWLLVVWLITGVMTLLGALSYAELAAMMPHAGGQYLFLRESYSPLFGFLYGWTSFTVIQTGTIAAVAVAFAKFLGVFIPELGTSDKARLFDLDFGGSYHFQFNNGQFVAIAIIIALTWWNTRGVAEGKWVQNIFTVAKIGGLLLVIVVGFTLAASVRSLELNFSGDLLPSVGSLAMWMAVGGALVGALFSSDAWNNVTFTASEVREPSRNLPLSLMIGTGLVTALYLLANGAYLTSLPLKADPSKREALRVVADLGKKAPEAEQELANSATAVQRGIEYARDDRVGTAVMDVVSPRYGAWIMAIAIMISTFGCVNGLILMGARLYYAMARDNLFFQRVGSLNRNGVPQAGLWYQAIWACLLAFSGTYSQLLDYVIFAALLFYVLTVTGLFVLRYRQPNLERPYRAIGYPVLPALYVILCAIVMLDLLIVKPIYTWPGLILVLAGIPVYFLWKGFRAAKS
jgi:APA family basic amino acid/polyamine antiporter